MQVQQILGCWLRGLAPRCRNPPGCKLIPTLRQPSIQAFGCGSIRIASETCFTAQSRLRVASLAIIVSSIVITTVGRLQAEKHRFAILKPFRIQPEKQRTELLGKLRSTAPFAALPIQQTFDMHTILGPPITMSPTVITTGAIIHTSFALNTARGYLCRCTLQECRQKARQRRLSEVAEGPLLTYTLAQGI